MNPGVIKGSWAEHKGMLLQKFASLTNNDLLFEEGRKEEMYGRLQVKLGKTREELLRIIGTL